MLENKLRKKCLNGPKLKWPILFKRFIDNIFGGFDGTKEEMECWILATIQFVEGNYQNRQMVF